MMVTISSLLYEKGTAFYYWGKFAIKGFLPAGFGLIALIQIISLLGWGYFTPEYFILEGTYGFVIFLMVLAYLAILIGLTGINFYFLGLHYMGLAQIAKNAESKE